MTRFSTTIRGGQNTLHNFRMTLQIMRESMIGACLAGIVVAGFVLWRTIPPYDFYVFVKYHWTDLLWGFSHDPRVETHFDMEDGETVVVTMRDLLQSETLIGIVRDVESAMFRALYWALGTAFVILLAIFGYFRFRGSVFQERFNEKGALSLVTPKELTKLISKRRRTPAQYSIAGVPYPQDAEFRHTIVDGTTGVGKTLYLRYLLKQIRAAGDRAVIYDRMGAFIGEFYDPDKGDVILNPLDARSPCWTPFVDVEDEFHFDGIAASMIPVPPTGDKQWAEASQLLMAEVMKKLKREKKRPTNADIIRLMVKTDMKATAAFVKGTFAHNVLPEGSPRTAASVLFTNTVALKNFRILRDAKKYFSIREWVKKDDGQGFLFLPMRADQKDMLQGMIAVWMDIAINALLSVETNPNRRIWFIIDELPTLKKMPAIASGLAETRQFGGCFVLTIQSLSQLREIYGDAGADSISNTANTRLIFQAVDQKMAELEAKNIGKQVYTEYDESLTYGAASIRDGVGLSERKKEEYIVEPGEILYLPERTAFLKYPGSLPPTKVEFAWFDRVQRNVPFLPLPGRGAPKNPDAPNSPESDDQGPDLFSVEDLFAQIAAEGSPEKIHIIDGPEIPPDKDSKAQQEKPAPLKTQPPAEREMAAPSLGGFDIGNEL